MRKVIAFFKNAPALFYFFSAFSFLALIMQSILVYAPEYKTKTQRASYEKDFDEFWKSTRAEQLSSVGLTPDEKLYNQEKEIYLAKYDNLAPTLIPDERVPELKKNFRTWWETEGASTFTAKGKILTDALYKSEEAKFIKEYTSKKTIFRMRLNPKDPEVAQFILHALLFPNIFVWLCTFFALSFAARPLTYRFGKVLSLGIFIAGIGLGACLIYVIASTSLFVHSDVAFTGNSLAVALLLGSVTLAPSSKNSQKLNALIASGFTALLIIITFASCSGIHRVSIVAMLLLFAVGLILGKFVPETVISSSKK